MNWRNVMLMRSVFGRWSMEVLPTLFFLPQVAWERPLPPLTNIDLARLLSEKWSSPYSEKWSSPYSVCK